MPQILLIEDEAAIADNALYALRDENFSVEWFDLAAPGLEYLRRESVDLVILDVGLPDMSGFDLCKQIREFSSVPLIFLTARDSEIDRVVGLEIGADDYVTKPFSPRELAARAKAILRRQTLNQAPTSPSNTAPCAFSIDSAKRQICYRARALALSSYQYGVLEKLLSQPERVFTREQLMDAVWPEHQESLDRAVDTTIKQLRAKLRAIDDSAEPLVTHRGVGYSIQDR
ncbi:MAG: two-component system response regulator CreB [Pseudomonadales bacterium]